MYTTLFDYPFSAGDALDIGRARHSNQDRVISRPEIGFFAVSDGMGGLAHGGETSGIIAEVLPDIVGGIAQELVGQKAGAKRYGTLLKERVRLVSDNIFDTVNRGYIGFGATLSCVWLIGKSAVYVNLGDSRGYLLPRYKRSMTQVTDDHNVAGELVRLCELTKEEAQGHPTSGQLTRFMGMPAPAIPDMFIKPVAPGDLILLCSDGLDGMMRDAEIKRILRSSRWQGAVCRRLVEAANETGGYDNISVVSIRVGKRTDETV